ncbi:MAG TPA: stage V sporulation protein T [Candidatus Mediterraneibacter faecavium]|uniref:Stage V sporulation protein T n=1 Tax=Candidatus Mediterraneibacter faecavium TaxID=2838668 RepID=A0A9D2Q908_9FIRM|nr:stage V sporulation protein T [Candidatus Mediterraneibacter faecavium]
MKATGIVRRIDDLGRVVIPKEIRRTLRIREGDPLEIFTDREGEIILKKYSPIGELGTLAKLYAESLSQTLGCTVCITDTDQVVAASGSGKKELQDQFIGRELDRLLKDRGQLLAGNSDSSYIKVVPDMQDFRDEAICPIISEGDVIGSVVLLNKDQKKKFGEVEQRVASSAADFLGRQMS